MNIDLNRLAEEAREAFFKVVFDAMPAGTSGDFPPDAHVAFEQAAIAAVRTIALNAPQFPLIEDTETFLETALAPARNSPHLPEFENAILVRDLTLALSRALQADADLQARMSPDGDHCSACHRDRTHLRFDNDALRAYRS